MQENYWTDKYPQGVPAEIDVGQYPNVLAVLKESCERFADKPAFTNLGKTITWGEMYRLSGDFAAYLQKHSGLQPGDRIAIQLPNVLQYPVVVFGAMRAGYVVVNTNPLYTAREMEHQFNDSGAKALVCLANMAHLAEQVVPKTGVKHVIVTEVGDMLPTFKRLLVNTVVKRVKKMVPAYSIPGAVPFVKALKEGAGGSFKEANPSADDTAVLQYTGGTTGRAKGAEITHGNLLANLHQILPVFNKAGVEEGREIFLSALPLYHIYALCLNLMVGMGVGAHSILVANPRKINDYPKLFREHRISMFPGLGTMFQALARNPDFVRCDHSALKVVLSGGMPLAPEVARQWHEVTGIEIAEGYGLTETSPVVALTLSQFRAHPGADGMLPLPGQQLRIVHVDDQSDLKTGEHGELWVRGPHVMAGYWQQPEETAQALHDGWLATGDIGSIDEEGLLRIHDRMKDLVIVSGFNVYPAEVEDALLKHPQVLEAAVVGLQTAQGKEEVVAVVVAKDPRPDEQELIEFCREALTRYKVPRRIVFRDELPKSNVGKVLRKPLRDELQKSA